MNARRVFANPRGAQDTGRPMGTAREIEPPAPRRAGEDLALVMSGGGARAAYQVGFLRCLAERLPDLRIPILTGVSAGAINAAFLASAPGNLRRRVDALVETWSKLEVGDVFCSDGMGLWSSVARWGLTLVAGGRWRTERHGMVDTTPLREFLVRLMAAEDGRLRGVDERLESGELEALAITTSSYTTGQSVTWVQGRDIQTWRRPGRISRHADLHVDHVMASSALPLFFPAVRIETEMPEGRPGRHVEWYGDGGIRLTAPLAPAVHLGAQRILAISTRYAASREDLARVEEPAYPPPAQIAGQLLNAIFLDQFDGDALRLERINRLLRCTHEESRGSLRPIDLLLLRPSADLGRLANEYEPRLPGTFRFLTRGFGTRQARSNDLLSLVMFQPDYLKRLIELGHDDAEERLPEIEAFCTAPAASDASVSAGERGTG